MYSLFRSLFFAACAFSMCVAMPRLSRAEDVSLTDLNFSLVQGQKLSLPVVLVKGSNLTSAQIARLFDPATTSDDRINLAQSLSADVIDIPTVTLVSKDSFVMRGAQMTSVAQGRFGRFVLSSVDGTQTNNNEKIIYKVGSFSIEQGDFNSMLNALQNGHIETAVAHFNVMSLAQLRITHPTFEGAKGSSSGDDVITLDSAVAHNDYKDNLLTSSHLDINNLMLTPAPSTSLAAALSQFGYDRLSVSLQATSNYNPQTQTYKIDDLTISGVKAGSIGLSSVMTHITPDIFQGSNAVLSALAQGEIDSLALRYEDAGLFDKSLTAVARQQNKSPEALRKEWIGMINQIVPLLVMGDPVGVKLAQALSTFIMKPSRFDLSLKARGGPIAFSDLGGLTDPSSFLARIDVDAQASGNASPAP